MELMIDSSVVKNLRKNRSWSQDQLAIVSGLSLRTIQRIEKENGGSLESAKAIASAFEVDVAALQIDERSGKYDTHMRRVRFYSFLGNTVGILCAFLGISFSFMNGNMSGEQAGMYYGGIGFVGGLFYVGLALMCEYFRKNRVGDW